MPPELTVTRQPFKPIKTIVSFRMFLAMAFQSCGPADVNALSRHRFFGFFVFPHLICIFCGIMWCVEFAAVVLSKTHLVNRVFPTFCGACEVTCCRLTFETFLLLLPFVTLILPPLDFNYQFIFIFISVVRFGLRRLLINTSSPSTCSRNCKT